MMRLLLLARTKVKNVNVTKFAVRRFENHRDIFWGKTNGRGERADFCKGTREDTGRFSF